MSYDTGDSAVLYLNAIASVFVAVVHVIQITYSLFNKFTKCDLRCKSCCGLLSGSALMAEEKTVTDEEPMEDEGDHIGDRD